VLICELFGFNVVERLFQRACRRCNVKDCSPKPHVYFQRPDQSLEFEYTCMLERARNKFSSVFESLLLLLLDVDLMVMVTGPFRSRCAAGTTIPGRLDEKVWYACRVQ